MKLSSMTYTIFTCGILYERFGPGGLNALQISTFENRHGAIGEEGNFLIDLRTGKSTIPVVSSTQELNICLTSLRDVARYVVAALKVCEDTSAWPREFNFCAERLTMSELRAICERVRGELVQVHCNTQNSVASAMVHCRPITLDARPVIHE